MKNDKLFEKVFPSLPVEVAHAPKPRVFDITPKLSPADASPWSLTLRHPLWLDLTQWPLWDQRPPR